MPGDFTIDVDLDMRELETRWGVAALTQRLRAAMDEANGYVQTEVRKNVPVDQGIHRGSVSTDIRGTPLDLRGIVFSPLATMEVLERGRKPNKPMPPKGVLLEWMARHSIEARLEFVIRRAIGKRGTKAHKMFELAYEQGKRVVPGIFARHLR